jgi:predicted membrane protein
MKQRASILKALFRGMSRLQETFTIDVGPVRATGVPAILVGVTGIVLASGITAALVKSAPRLPETLGEARGLAETITGAPPRLKS